MEEQVEERVEAGAVLGQVESGQLGDAVGIASMKQPRCE